MFYLSDFHTAEFKKEKKRRQNKDWNNWEKAREIRSALSTGQRLSQDVRGWLNLGSRLGG